MTRSVRSYQSNNARGLTVESASSWAPKLLVACVLLLSAACGQAAPQGVGAGGYRAGGERGAASWRRAIERCPAPPGGAHAQPGQ